MAARTIVLYLSGEGENLQTLDDNFQAQIDGFLAGVEPTDVKLTDKSTVRFTKVADMDGTTHDAYQSDREYYLILP